MTTMEDVVAETRRYLHGGHQDLLDVLDTTLDSSTTSVVVTDSVKGMGRGSVIEIGTETMYVRSADEGTKTLTVMRGHDGTTAAAHTAGDFIRVNPSYSTNEIFRAALDEIAGLKGAGLYQFDTQELEYNFHDRVYDLTLDITDRDPLFVYNAVYERSTMWESWAPTRVHLLRDMNVTDFPSGYGLKVVGGPRGYSPGGAGTVTIRATVALSLGLPTALTDTLSEADNGIGPHIVPAIAAGAAWRMLLGKEARRVNPDASHGSRRAEEIAPGSISFLGRAMQSLKEDLIQDAIEVQYKKYPPRQDL